MLIGRKSQKAELQEALESEYSEFVAVYGRRRVGKTFLIREMFNYHFTFEHAGVANSNMQEQLYAWKSSLNDAGLNTKDVPSNWLEAFDMLKDVIRASDEKKKVIFIDEMPWMDTPRSRFVSALEFFWNSWASARKDILLIICGSATSWIVNNVFKNHGGLHNRVTHRIFVEPFCLAECEEFVKSRNIALTRYDIIEGYMIMGGVPFYWSMLERGLSLNQNVDKLFFSKNGKLRYEFNELYDSLFRNPDKYINVVTILANKKSGMEREEIVAEAKVPNNGNLTKILEDLEHCGFICRFNKFGQNKNNAIYRLIDNFTLFYFKFMANNSQNDEAFWTNSYNTSTRYSWVGLAFERVCFQHVVQIKNALGIGGVTSAVCSWSIAPQNPQDNGAQIDMLIDRADNVINLCEIKFSHDEYKIDKDYDQQLRRKISRFAEATNTHKAIHLTMITTYGVARNAYWNQVQKEVTADDLFKA